MCLEPVTNNITNYELDNTAPPPPIIPNKRTSKWGLFLEKWNNNVVKWWRGSHAQRMFSFKCYGDK